MGGARFDPGRFSRERRPFSYGNGVNPIRWTGRVRDFVPPSGRVQVRIPQVAYIQVFVAGVSRETDHPVFECHPEKDQSETAPAWDSCDVGAVDGTGKRLEPERATAVRAGGETLQGQGDVHPGAIS